MLITVTISVQGQMGEQFYDGSSGDNMDRSGLDSPGPFL